MAEQEQTLTIQQAIDLGVQHHNEGRLSQAESIYNQILQSDPNQPIALHLLGVIAHQKGRNDTAVNLITKALSLKPELAEAHNNLGNALQGLGKLGEAVDSHRKALAVKPGFIEAHKNLISSLNELGKSSEKQQLRNDKNFSKRLDFFYSYLQTLGVLNSDAKEVVNGKQETIPLLTNSFLHWFETINWSNMSLLELGSGNSTLYFSRFFKLVTSYESNEKWYKALGPKLPNNVNYIYAHPIRSSLEDEDTKKYDVILLDAGENRAKLARMISKTSYSGLIFFDNSEWYRQSVNMFSEVGFAEIPFFGIKPIQDWVSCTSVLVKSENLFNRFTSDWSHLPDLVISRNNEPLDNENSKE